MSLSFAKDNKEIGIAILNNSNWMYTFKITDTLAKTLVNVSNKERLHTITLLLGYSPKLAQINLSENLLLWESNKLYTTDDFKKSFLYTIV